MKSGYFKEGEDRFTFKFDTKEILSEDIVRKASKRDKVILNMSYLMASDSIDPKEQARDFNNFNQPSIIMYQNPDSDELNEKYEQFKRNLKGYESLVDSETVSTTYKVVLGSWGHKDKSVNFRLSILQKK